MWRPRGGQLCCGLPSVFPVLTVWEKGGHGAEALPLMGAWGMVCSLLKKDARRTVSTAKQYDLPPLMCVAPQISPANQQLPGRAVAFSCSRGPQSTRVLLALCV